MQGVWHFLLNEASKGSWNQTLITFVIRPKAFWQRDYLLFMDRLCPERLKPWGWFTLPLVLADMGLPDFWSDFGNWDKGRQYLWLGFEHSAVTQVHVTAWMHLLWKLSQCQRSSNWEHRPLTQLCLNPCHCRQYCCGHVVQAACQDPLMPFSLPQYVPLKV